MACFLRSNDDELIKADIYYVNIKKLLPGGVKYAEKVFKLHGTTWRLLLSIQEGFLCAGLESKCMDIEKLHRSFAIRVGIVEDDQKEIIVPVTCIGFYEKMISCSQLDSMFLKNKCCHLFVEIERKCENSHNIKVCK